MSEPTRLIGSGGLKGKLLASAKQDRPPKGSRRRAVLAAAAAAAASTKAASATATLSSAATTLGRWAVWKWIAVGALGAGTVVAAKAVILPRPPDTSSIAAPQTLPASSPALRTRRDPATVSPLSSVSAQAPPPSPVSTQADLASPPEVDDTRSAAAPVPPPVVEHAHVLQAQAPKVEPPKEALRSAPSSALSAEIAAIDQAKRALASSDAEEALRRVDAYRAEFPGGMLAAEATGLCVQALARAGRHDEARAELARLRASHPDSPLLENLAQLVGE